MLVVIDGPDGVGKTTVVDTIKKRFGKSSKLLVLESPCKTDAVGTFIRSNLSQWPAEIDVLSMLFADALDCADHIQAYRDACPLILLDRWMPVTAQVYQCAGDTDAQARLQAMCAHLPAYDKCVILHAPAPVIRARLYARDGYAPDMREIERQIEEYAKIPNAVRVRADIVDSAVDRILELSNLA